jgi:hypothetical protein
LLREARPLYSAARRLKLEPPAMAGTNLR